LVVGDVLGRACCAQRCDPSAVLVGEAVVGVALGALVLARRSTTWANAAIASATALVTAIALVVVYSRDLIAVLP
jgi:hypothetical protein